MAAREILAGKAVVEVGTRLAIEKGLQAAEDRFRAFGSGIGKLSQSVAIAGGIAVSGAAAAFAPLLSAAKQFADIGGALDDMSQRTGASVSALSALGYAAKQSGSSLQAVEGGIRKTQKAIIDALDGNKQLGETFARLGLEVDLLAKLDPAKQFETLAQAVGSIPDPTLRAATAMQLFGKSGTELLPLMRSDMRALTEEARSLGIVMDGEAASSAAALGDAFDKVSDVIGAAWVKIGAALAPVLTDILDRTVAVVASFNEWVGANQQLVVFIAGVAVAVGIAGFALVGLAIAGGGAAFVLTTLGTLSGIAATAYGFLAGMITAASGATTIFGFVSAAVLSPIYAVVGAVGAIAIGVVALIAAWAGVGLYLANEAGLLRDALTWLQTKFGELFSTVKTTMAGVMAAFSAGQYALAAQVLWAGVKLAFWQGADAALEAVGKLASNALSIFHRMNLKLAELMYNLAKSIPSLLAAGFSGGSMQKILAQLFTTGLDLGGILDSQVAAAEGELKALTAKLPKPKQGSSAGGADGVQAQIEKAMANQQRQMEALNQLQNNLQDGSQQPNNLQGGNPQSPQSMAEGQANADRVRPRGVPQGQLPTETLQGLQDARSRHEMTSYGSGSAFDAAEQQLRQREMAFQRSRMLEAAKARTELNGATVDLKKPTPLPSTPDTTALTQAVGGAQKEMKTSSVGTFSAAAVGMIGGGAVDERVATNTAAQVQLMRQMLKQRQRGPSYA